MKEDFVVLVDEHDHHIGVCEKLNAHKNGLLHRAFSVFLYRNQGDVLQILMQQRQRDKYHSAGLWTNTCCSHPSPGEDLDKAVMRRLYEELGIENQANIDLKHKGSFVYKHVFHEGMIEHERDHVYVGMYDGDVALNTAEVCDARYWSLNEIKESYYQDPSIFTPWFMQALTCSGLIER